MSHKYALVIGIENYPKESGQKKVPYALNDARAISGYLEKDGQSIERFRTFVLRNKYLLMNTDAFCLALSYDYRTKPTLDNMTKISDELYKNSKKDADFIWSCTHVQKLNTDFRATLISVEK